VGRKGGNSMTDDHIYAATLRTLKTMSDIHRNLVVGFSRSYSVSDMIDRLEEMMIKQVDFLHKQQGQVTKQTPADDEIPF
jgi:hypothetical protein